MAFQFGSQANQGERTTCPSSIHSSTSLDSTWQAPDHPNQASVLIRAIASLPEVL